MTLYDFKRLERKAQGDILWEEGVFLADREEAAFSVVLYALHSFYVEVFYHRQQNQIDDLKSFSSTERLSPYLNQINLNGIL